MNKNHISRLFQIMLFATLALPTTSCVPAVAQISAFQFCFSSHKDVNYLKALLQTIALKEHMRYSDDSGETYDNLVGMDIDKMTRMRREKFIKVHIRAEDGLGASAINIGTEDQAIVLVSAGREIDVAHAFADRIEATLKKHWNIHTTEGHKPNYPLDCAAQ